MRAAMAIAGSVLVALGAAAPASGHGILRQEADVLRYTAPDPGFGATLTVSSPERGILEFFDSTSPGGMDWGPCVPVNERRSRCPAKGVARVEIEVYDGDDTVTVRVPTPVEVRGGSGNDLIAGGYGDDVIAGGSGDDVISGGLGADLLDGAEGNDAIDARDGFADAYSCGEGLDSLASDPDDAADSLEPLGCESAEVAEPPPDASPPGIDVAAKRIRPSRSGALPVPVALDEPGTVAVGGAVLIRGSRAGGLRTADAEPDSPDQVWTVRPGLSKRLERRVRRALDRGARVKLKLRIEAADAAGNESAEKLRLRVAAR